MFQERRNLFYLIDFGLLSGEKSHPHGSPHAYNRRHRAEAGPSIAGTQCHPAKHDATTKITLARDAWFSSAQSTSRDADIDTVSGEQSISCPYREKLTSRSRPRPHPADECGNRRWCRICGGVRSWSATAAADRARRVTCPHCSGGHRWSARPGP
jgi:hypothetical protein